MESLRRLTIVALVVAALAAAPGHAAEYRQATLVPSQGTSSGQFGSGVALSGDTALVGARYDDRPAGSAVGSAWVWVRSGPTWSEQARLLAFDGAASDYFGSTVALFGDTAVVGAPGDDLAAGVDAGSAYVFVRSGTTWVQQAKLTASDGLAGDVFGWSVAIMSDTILVGARGDDVGTVTNAGSAYVFIRSGTTWSQQAKLTSSDAGTADFFGTSVSLASPATTAVIGAPNDSHAGGNGAGSAYVFTASGTVWSQQAKLTAQDASTLDQFGTSVAISGGSLAVGAAGDDTAAGSDQGSAYVFTRSGTIWSLQAKLTAADGDAQDSFGESVAIEADTLLVGADNDEAGGPNAGAGYLFRRVGATWSQFAKLPAGIYDQTGSSVALQGDTRILGSPSGGTGAALVYVEDVTGPSIAFDQGDGDIVVYVSVAANPATGTVTAQGAGVTLFEIVFVNDLTGASTTAPLTLDCNAAGTSCTWQVDRAPLPGRYTMHATATDAAGNVTARPGPSVFVIGPGARSI